ncbi:OLC1v1032411C1 [Oldenlandia corymbosa var. corymbosa]|uniref:OLC1v1032411C1 n=1 Tax=Oldenlandia corymbosa var. corymbosa TaxID=529605 RepID=A0AAV1CLK2_OLDCO|nr:OLC1v1032411C1 [Oldenlandia corymbosa var. corymbosa]
MESFSCQDFKVGKREGEKVVDGETIPLVLQPRDTIQNDVESLLVTLKKNKEWFEAMIIKHSAVLLRGFDVKNAEDFNEIVELFGWEEIKYVGPAIRTNVHKRVWTANEGPLSDSLPYHHEMAQFTDKLSKLILYCEIPPPEGGETPIVPSFRVAERMKEEFPEMVEEMEKKGLMYMFPAPSKNDASSMRGRGWEDVFGTSDRAEAEKRGKLMGMKLEWLPDGGVKTFMGPYPLTKEFEGRKGRKMWFNSLNFHGKNATVTMTDGTEIPQDLVKRIDEIMEEESIQFKWNKGDILFLDNKAVLHGRRSSLPPRRVLVAICK